MTDKTTATEIFRQLLDDRGVEYETYHDAALTEVDAVFWQDRNSQPCSAIGNADDIPDGMLSVQCIISPEQAVEATLGRGTCKDIAEMPKFSDKTRFECSECGYEYSAVGGFGCDTCDAMLDCDECLRADASHKELRGLKVETKALRELVRDMMRFFEEGDYCTICEKAAECESLDEYGHDCLMRGVYKARMRELRIEVAG